MSSPAVAIPTPRKTAALLHLSRVRKTFDGLNAVDTIDLTVREGEFFTIVGPSGSGKTTLLRMLAGMDRPTAGDIVLRGVSISSLPPNKRPTCLVFQSLALFPHKSVGQNIEFPLKMRKVGAEARRERAEELMRMVRLPESYYAKNVMKCSGGERQRVALARAFAYDPEILLFDEPLSAIDYKLRKTLEKELKDLHRQSGKTFIYITHSLEEAMVMSDRIGVMQAGKLVQVGTPEEIYMRPTNRFVGEFMGETNVLPVRSDGYGGFAIAELPDKYKVAGHGEALEGFIVLRPEFVQFVEAQHPPENTLRGRICNEYSLGSRVQYQVQVGKRVILMEQPRGALCPPGDGGEVLIGWNAADAAFVAE
ncbi:ABC transporter protein [Rhodospirillum rubrum F11]|uniref:ABC transporter component n=3 Tax=Rhodospirillum rubrum TaxID=1085 RepID=Q2RPY6_RHORT|nr:ABC transporter ATP-binding protein [Rhodospirillum rubrum]ABC23809.1 ABC transporter component [Rhodospirillum rubrum ATCC 11170]AEO49549.1 ABC transporter protein [Rhodospirillum rubrum F11]MBK5955485.1 ABC transporter ATP-binding protein [Rhodospirillum rubrum]QXG79756.1 ABC transporter ATP-binding protein [Rhodospirillum rubrum]